MNKHKMGRFGKTGLLFKQEYIERAYEMLSGGKSIQEVCTEFFVVEDTFMNWRRLNDELDTAVKLGTQAGIAYWLNYGRKRLDDPDFNESAFNTYLGRVYGIGKMKAKRIDLRADKIVDSYKKLLEIVSEGKIDSKASTELSKLLLAGATLKEHTELSDKIESLEAKLDAKN